MERSEKGFREQEHTADWELEVWAPNLPVLLEQAAIGMYTLSGITLSNGPKQSHQVNLSAYDPESLLVGFLQELLYQAETARVGFDRFDIHLYEYHLDASLDGAPIQSITKEIKAVTYHNLRVQEGERGLEVRIVFDV